MLKWAAITFGVGMLIILMEWNMAKKKKEGVTWTDKKRMTGIFWVSCAMAALVAGLIWMGE
jgi:cytochrome bd-type quinol oxidase subunit 1